MTHISDQTSVEISHICGLNQSMMTSWIAYPQDVLKPVPTKIYTASFYAKGDVDPKFYKTCKDVGGGWFQYAKKYNSIDDAKFPVGAWIMQVEWEDVE